jgi:hypothetical protein
MRELHEVAVACAGEENVQICSKPWDGLAFSVVIPEFSDKTI